ncbi:MMPL family transporter [Microlunatus elymi]|uniref:MMPL family transporter n=1 Tax=Microlunatus elymi TaxID=2596828 RepID=UPI001D181CCC|nr:MMPL family transporter [Microlunatus elymi]
MLRVFVPALLIIGWLVAASIGGPYFGKVDEVSSNEATSYLPASADSTQVQQRLPDFLGGDTIPAIVVFVSDADVDQQQLGELQQVTKNLGDVPGVDSVSPAVPSKDGKAAEAFVAVDADADVESVVSQLRDQLRAQAPAAVTVHVTGPAGFTADLTEAFAGIDGLLLGVALAAVLIILVIVYRSLLLPLLVLITSMFALCTALLTVWWLAKAGVLVLTGQTQGILFILVIGAATDYSLLYTARYREELRRHRDKSAATWAALRAAREPIIASAGTVIAGLLCLLLSDLNSNKSLGPVAAIGIGFALLAALTLLPAALFALGRVAFWPRTPRYAAHAIDASAVDTGLYARIAALIGRRARLLWIVITVLLLAAATGLSQLHADGVAQSELVTGPSDARDGQNALSQHFPGGSGSPVYIIVKQQDLQRAADIAAGLDGIASVSVTSADAPGGSAPVTADGITPVRGKTPAPTVKDGDVLLQATLKPAPDSAEAEQVVINLRDQLGDLGIVGGATATAVDTNATAIHDRNVIIPVVLVVIMLILMLLLRSVIAPVLLIITTVLSLAATLGISALVFNHILDLPGADPSVPLYGFVFLVALGVDYNIFLMTRVREESLELGTRAGIAKGLAITGGVITSAGLVLAATFAALAVIPILFLLQLAFIVAFGVLLDTFVVRTLLLPAIAHDLGHRIWWPSRLASESSRTGRRTESKELANP